MKIPSIDDNRAVLNQMLNLQRFSLANYLRYARPWAGEADHLLRAVVFGIADAQSQNANRIGELLVERHASVEPGAFPKRFTGSNDVSIRYAAPRVVDDLGRITQSLRWCAADLGDDAVALDLVQSILGDDQRHLLILRDELEHLEQTSRVEPQWACTLNGDGKLGTENSRPSPAEVAEMLQPA
jgi:hypothetical protein